MSRGLGNRITDGEAANRALCHSSKENGFVGWLAALGPTTVLGDEAIKENSNCKSLLFLFLFLFGREFARRLFSLFKLTCSIWFIKMT